MSDSYSEVSDSDVMLTTYDNPYNPFTQFVEWNAYDILLGHHTTELLGRIALTAQELPEQYNNYVIVEAMREIVREDVLGIYRLIGRNETPIVILPG